MTKLLSLLVTGFLLVTTFGCQDVPSITTGATQLPEKSTSETNKTPDNTIKSTAKETTIPVTGKETKTPAATKLGQYLKTIVSKKLEVGIPGNKFVVENKQGEIILKGTASSQEELEKAEKLVKEVKGVKSVKVEAKVEPSKKS